MDTRLKIVPAEQAPSGDLILASFDVLTAERIRRLRDIRRESACLIAVVTELPGSLLTVTARAELAASLSLIDWVVLAEDPKPLMERATKIYDEREADARSAAALLQYVHQRNSA